MSPRPRLPKIMWNEDSIRVETRTPSPADEEENNKVFSACINELNAARIRVMIGCYGPGTGTSPKARYYWALGESSTVLCRDLDTVNWFREELLKWLQSLDGVKLAPVEEDTPHV